MFILKYKSYFLNGIHNATIIAVMTVGMLKLDPGVHFNYVKWIIAKAACFTKLSLGDSAHPCWYGCHLSVKLWADVSQNTKQSENQALVKVMWHEFFFLNECFSNYVNYVFWTSGKEGFAFCVLKVWISMYSVFLDMNWERQCDIKLFSVHWPSWGVLSEWVCVLLTCPAGSAGLS